MEDSQKYRSILELTFSSFSENGVREETDSERYEILMFRKDGAEVLCWDSEDGEMIMEFRPGLVLVLREGSEVSYRMELIMGRESVMELESPHGTLRFRVRTLDLSWRKDPDFPKEGGLYFLLVYELLSGDSVVATRMMSGKTIETTPYGS